MSTAKRISRLAFLTVMLAAGAHAQTPTYNLILRNDAVVDSTRYEFEIWIERTGGVALELASLQPIMTFNTGISAGTLSLSLNSGTSELNSLQEPTVMSVTGNELRINPRTPPGAGAGTVVPTSPGLRIGRFRITSTTAFTAQQAGIEWKNAGNPYTRVFAYNIADANVEVTDSSGHLNSLADPILSVPVITSTSPRPAATAGVLYRDTLRAQSGTPPYTWSTIAGSLPAGMTMTAAGIISGTATNPGTSNFTARVADNLGAADSAAFSLTVNVGTPSQLAFVQQPTDELAGTFITPAPSVRVTDNVGNTVPAAGIAITMALTSGNGTLSGSLTELTNASGVATFDSLRIDRKGLKVITASSGVTSSVASASFTILSAVASQIRVETAADGTGIVVPAQNLAPFTPLTVYAVSRDAFDNFIENIAASAWSLQGATGGVTGGDLVPAGDNRSAVFTGHLVGSAQIRATSPPLTAVNSGTITVIPGAANKLTFVQQPSNAVTGAVIAPAVTVQIRDSANNAVSAQNIEIDLTLSSGTGTLGGTLTRLTNASGLATFDDLTVSQSGTKALTAASTGLTPAVSAGFTISDLTITATAGPNGTITPSGTVPVSFGASQAFAIAANSGFHILNVLVDGTPVGPVSNYNFTNVVANHTISASFAVDTVQVTVATSPSGRSIVVDGVPLTAPQVFNWVAGSSHTIAADSIQSGTAGTRYVYQSWSDAGAISHTVSPSSNTTYTATFGTQYLLTMIAGSGGTVSPPSAWENAAAVVPISATPNTGFSFSSWTGTGSGSYSGTANPSNVTMNGPITETASFGTNPISVTVTTNPAGRQIVVDGVTFTSPQVFNWTATQSHTISVDSLQGDAATRYLYTSWSDAGARTHTVAPLTDSVFTAGLSIQYFLTMSAGTGGTASPVSDWKDPGTVVGISATPSTGYSFASWSGSGTGSYTGNANPSAVTMNGPITESASFTPNAISYTVTTSPLGLEIIVDDTVYTSPHTFIWLADQPHTISVDSLQNGAAGIRYLYASWSNGGARTQTITPLAGGTVTAAFTTQYLLTMVANPGGAVTPPSSWFNAATPVTITAIPDPGYVFSSWSGTGTGQYTGTVNPSGVTMNGPITETANFVQPPVNVTIQTNPAGRVFVVDGLTRTNTFTFSFSPGATHTVSADSIQNGATGTRYAWTSWSDGGARSHTLTYPGRDTTFIVNFKTQFQLTMSAGTGGTVSPPTGYFDSAQVVGISATPGPTYTFSSWTGTGTGSYTGPNNPSSVTMTGPVAEAASFVLAPIDVTVTTNPPGLTFTVDGTTFTAPQNFVWSASAVHQLGTTSPQGDTATRHLYSGWSDGGAQIHNVAPLTDTSFTVSFSTQYFLTTDTGTGFGSVSPASNWFNAGQSVQISAAPDIGYNFAGWTGTGASSYTGPNNPQNITMNSPVKETANWSAGTIPVTVTTSPAGLAITVDGVNYTSPQVFNWTTGSAHTIAADSLQAGGLPGARYRWLSWNDAGARSHIVTPMSPSTFTASFRSQYLLTMVANPGGTVTPATSWYDSASSVVITGVPNTGYGFSTWSGTGTGSYSGSANPRTISILGPITETANFTQLPVQVTIQTNPPGRNFRVDGGGLITNTYTFTFSPGETHTVVADSIQSQTTTSRFVWTSWSDGGARSHTLVYPGKDTTFVVNFKTQFFLTMNAAAGGTTSPASGFFDSAQVVGIIATPSGGYSFSGWTGAGSGSYTGPNNPASVTMNEAVSETPNFTLTPIDVTIQTSPPGRTFTVDGVSFTGPQNFVWSATAVHQLSTTSPQGDTATRYLYSSWSDGGAQTHNVAPVGDTTFTLNFSTQYYLTTDTGTGFGSVSPASNWFNAGQTVEISAVPEAGYTFAGWTGTGASSYTGPNNPQNIIMNSPVTETANWSAGTIPVTVTTSPAGLAILVDGVNYTSPQTFNWTTGSVHTISADSIQASGIPGQRYRWTSWSDAGALTHTVSPASPVTYTAAFVTQYLLTMIANPGGTVTPATGWHDAASSVVITGIPNTGYVFSTWSGTGTGAYSGSTNPRTITIGGAITQTANFAQLPVQVTIQTNPPGRTFRVDAGALQTNTYTFTYSPGDVPHTVTADSIQGQTIASRFVWTSWSDGGARTHTIPFPGRDTTIIVNFKTQYYLTMSAGSGGTVQPLSGYFDSASAVVISAVPANGYAFSGWLGLGSGSYTGPNNPGSVTMDSAISELGTFTLAPVNVTVQSNPPGLQFIVDAVTYTGSQAFVWSATSVHTLSAISPQGDTATRHLFTSWSDGGAQLHNVAPVIDTTFTVNYSTQYYLTMDTGTGGGTLSPPSGFFDAGQAVEISAVPRAGYNFGGWTGTGTGSYTGPNNPAGVTMNSPVKETAVWTAGTIPITVTTVPAGLSILVDGTAYTSPQTFNWTTGSSHTISADSLQPSGTTGQRYRWTSWSDAGSLTHTVAPTSATTFTASFGTQYLLTMVSNGGGTVTPPTGWYDAATPVTITGIPSQGYSFTSWTGTGLGSYSGGTNPRVITMNGPINETATFTQNPVSVTIQAQPAAGTFRVDGSGVILGTYTFSFGPGTTHTLSADSIQPQTATSRLVWTGWSDGGARSHTMFFPGRDTTIYVYFKTQYYLTMSSGSGGSVLPASAYHDSGAAVGISATPSIGYTFAGWVGSGQGSYSGTDNPATVTMNGPVTETASFTLFPITVRLRSNPPGRRVMVDSVGYDTPQDLIWTSGTSHTVSADSVQDDTAGVRHIWTGWSDGKARTHTVTGFFDTTFTVNFRQQYYLTMNAGTGGTVAPANAWHDSGASVPITATPATGYNFQSWTGAGSGSYTGTLNPSAVTMSSPITETASFTLKTISVTVRTNPDGYPVIVDDTLYTSPKIFQWTATSSHTISTDSVQPPSGGTRLAWNSWSDGGARTHVVAPLTDSIFTAALGTQYYVTMNANPGGTVTPPTGWFNAGQTIQINAIPSPGYAFSTWSGSGPGSYSGGINPRSITIIGPITETANFTLNPILVTVRTDPPGRTFRASPPSGGTTTYTSLNTFSMTPGIPWTLAADSIQAGLGGRRYVWTSWSDGGALSHTYVPPSQDDTVVVSFGLQYALSTFPDPLAGGTVQPAGLSYHNAGDTATALAVANTGYAFTGWSGSITDTVNPVRVVMDTAKTLTAQFEPAAIVVINSNLPGRTVMVDGFATVTPDTFSWLMNSTHSLGTSTPQSGDVLTQYLFREWSDSGSISHQVTVDRDTVFTVHFQAQHYLLISSDSNGTVQPDPGWYNEGASVVIYASPKPGYGFIEWTGSGPGGYTGFSNPATLTMSGYAMQVASFGQVLPPPSLTGIPNHAVDQPIIPRLSWNPYPGANSYIVQVALDSFFAPASNIVDTSGIVDTTILLPVLKNVETYFWRVKARVGPNITAFSETRDFMTIGATIAVTSPALNWGTGFTYDISWSSQNLSGMVNILLSTDGGSAFTIIDSNLTGSSARYRVQPTQTPSNFCFVRVVSAENGQFYGDSRSFAILPGALPLIAPVSAVIPYPAEPTISTYYRLVSYPGVVDTTIRLSALIPGAHPEDWRMFADNGLPQNYLVEMGPASHFETGRGFWMLKRNDFSVSANMVMPPLDTVNGVYRIRLRSGWNVVANPFDRNASWSSILALNGLPPSTPLYGYEGSYLSAALLAPFRGYYFYNATNLQELKIAYPFGTAIPSTAARDVDWELRMEYSSDINDDPANYIGVAPSAKDGYDELESHKPPLFLDQGFLYFKRPDWDSEYDLFNTDFRPAIGEGQTWEFEVAKEYGTTGTLRFEGVEGIPPEYEVVLVNRFNSAPVNLRAHPEYAFESVSSRMPFRILVGPAGYVKRRLAEELPTEFELSQNFPNPFNSTTSISVKLPRDARIRLDVYSVLGQKVATLADGDYSAGVHTFLWEGIDDRSMPVASGVYLYRLMEDGAQLQAKKMIIAK